MPEFITKDAAQCWGADATKYWVDETQKPMNDAYAVVLGLIGTIGLFRQWDALDRSLDLAERQVEVAEDYYDLAVRNYEDITLNAYTCQKDLFTRYIDDFAQTGKEFVDFAAALPHEYARDYALYEGRAMAGVGAQFSRARQRRSRQRSKYGTGQCCHEELQIDIAQAMALNEAANRGYRYEDQRGIQLDQWYFQKFEVAANFVQQMRANVISGVNSGVANATGGISAIGGAVQQMGQATGMAIDATNNQASFWGSVSNGAFGMMGALYGQASVGGGQQFQLPGLGQNIGPQVASNDTFLGGAGTGGGFFGGGKLGGGFGSVGSVGAGTADPMVIPFGGA